MFDTMISRDIRQTLDHFRRSVDQLFADFPVTYGWSGSAQRSPDYTFTPPIETHWTDNELYLRAVLPGVTEKDVKVTVQDERLIIEGERKMPEGWTDRDAIQLLYGKFYASIPLAGGLDLDHVACRLHDGVLDIKIPVAERMKPKHIPIQSGEFQKAIAA